MAMFMAEYAKCLDDSIMTFASSRRLSVFEYAMSVFISSILLIFLVSICEIRLLYKFYHIRNL